MRISISTDPLASRFSIEEMFAMISEAGFDAVDLGEFIPPVVDWLAADDYISSSRSIKAKANAAGLLITQLHAPFPTYFEIDTDGKNSAVRKLLIRSIESASELECPYVIVHPAVTSTESPKFGDKAIMREINLELYSSLLPHAKRAGVKIAVENIFTFDETKKVVVPCYSSDAADLLDLIQTLGDGMAACIDVGHSVLTGQAIEEQIKLLGGYLKTLHIQAHDGVRDLHSLPFVYGDVDWGSVIRALRDVGYDGTFNLEVFGYLQGVPDGLVQSALVFAAEAARYIADLV